MAVIPYSSRLAPLGRFARRMALLATFMKETMACQPLLLYHTCGNTVNDVFSALLIYNVYNIDVSFINYSIYLVCDKIIYSLLLCVVL